MSMGFMFVVIKHSFIISVIVLLLTSCSPLLSATCQSYLIQITSVVDHITGEPVRTNTIWVTIEKGGDDMVEFTDNNIIDFRIKIPFGDEAYILVEAPGYEDWERVVEAKGRVYEEVIVELVPVGYMA